jgi:hypothetical protein
MASSETRIQRVGGEARRRLVDGLVMTAIFMGCFWYFTFRLLGIGSGLLAAMRGRTVTAGAGLTGMPAAAASASIEMVSVVALCAFLFGVAGVLPYPWMVAAGIAFIAFDVAGYLFFGSAGVLLLEASVGHYILLVLLTATCVHARQREIPAAEPHGHRRPR